MNWSAQQFIHQLKLIKSNKVLVSPRESIKQDGAHVIRVATSLKCVSFVTVVRDSSNGFKLNCSQSSDPCQLEWENATQGSQRKSHACISQVCARTRMRSFELLINTFASYHRFYLRMICAPTWNAEIQCLAREKRWPFRQQIASVIYDRGCIVPLAASNQRAVFSNCFSCCFFV